MVNPRQTSQTARMPVAREELYQWIERGKLLLDRCGQLAAVDEAGDGQLAANQGTSAEYAQQRESAARELAALRVELESLEIAHFDLACRNMGALRLHACSELGEVINTLVEITLNFLGFGSFALYLSLEQEREFVAVASEGLNGEDGIELQLSQAIIESLCQGQGRLGAAGVGPLVPMEGEAGIVPLVVEGRLAGALRLVHAFPQKRDLTDSDLEYLSILSEHGGLALRRAWILSNSDRAWWSRCALKDLLNA